MADYSTDEERFAAFVNFFKDNKNTLLGTFLLISIVLISNIGYKSYTSSQNLKAAEIYDTWFLNMLSDSNNPDDVIENYDQLQDGFAKTGYAQLARMIKGSSLAKEGDLDEALKEFNALLDSSSGLFEDSILNSIAKINIARIQLSKQNFSDVLAVLESFSSSSEHPLVYEVKGDALVGLAKNNLALNQYELALQNSRNESQKSLIKMKINKLNN